MSTKAALFTILGLLAALWIGLESGFRIGERTERLRSDRALVQTVESHRALIGKAYQQGWSACMEQF